MIVGIDEVGRGCLAGPLCVAAVAWPADVVLPGLTDSKLISAKRRRELAMMIRHHATAIGIGWAAACEIDRIGLSHALRQAAEQALSQINVEYTTIVVDGIVPLVQDKRATCVIKADLTVPAVSAASIIAKVARDTYMQTRHSEFTQYAFDRHVGYGTARHLQALKQYGPCDLHRMSFAPLKALA